MLFFLIFQINIFYWNKKVWNFSCSENCWGENSNDVYLVFTFSFAYFFYDFLICAHKIVRDQTKIWKCPMNSINPRRRKKNIASESGSGTIVTLADLFDFLSKSWTEITKSRVWLVPGLATLPGNQSKSF